MQGQQHRSQGVLIWLARVLAVPACIRGGPILAAALQRFSPASQ
jgi:hypothetical protein